MSKERVLFINLPHISYESFMEPTFTARATDKVSTDMPLGILSLSSYLKANANVETDLLDFNVLINKFGDMPCSFKTLYHTFLDGQHWYNPTIIAISCLFTPAYQNMMDVAECARDIFPDAVIVAGGGVPTNMYHEIFRDSQYIDGLCYGEGEKPLLELVKAQNKRELLRNHPSWIIPAKLERRNFAPCNTMIQNLDEIPFYDYDLLNMVDYSLNPSITAYAAVPDKTNNVHVMTSLACNHKCIFCASHKVHGRTVRFFSLERVKNDITHLATDYGAKTLVFQDDHLMADKNRFLEVVGICRDLRLKMVFQNALAMYALDRKTLEILKESGINQLSLSAESGSDRVLRDIMHKPLNTTIISRVAHDCRELGIYTNMSILLGLPGETKQDIEQALEYFRTVGANWYLIFCASPLIGSEMYDICKTKGYLNTDAVGVDYKHSIVGTEDFTADYIRDMAYLYNLDLNFVHNFDYLSGQFETALKGFQHVLEVKPDHAFAHYYAGQCYWNMGQEIKALASIDKAHSLFDNDEIWNKYADKFDISRRSYVRI